MKDKKTVRFISMACALLMLLSVFSVSALAVTYKSGTKQIILSRSGYVLTVTASDEASSTTRKDAKILADGVVRFSGTNVIWLSPAVGVTASGPYHATSQTTILNLGSITSSTVRGVGTVDGWSIEDYVN